MKIVPQRHSRKTRRTDRLRRALASRQARRTVLVGSILGLMGVTVLVRGASPTPLNWNPNTPPASATDGGAGTWDLVTANWYNPATTADQVWQNDGSGVALFGGATGGLVSASALNVGGMTFNTTGYTVQGGPLTLGGGANGLALPTITIVPAVTATVTAVLAGSSGLTITGGGKLILGGTETLTGGIVIDGSTLQTQAAAILNANVVSFTATAGGDFQLGGFNQTIGGLSGANGTVENAGATAATLTLSGIGTSAFGGVIQNGTGSALSLTITSGTQTLSGVNTYTGVTTVSGTGILRAATSASALGAGSLTLTGGELQLAGDTGLAFNRNTTVSGDSQITSDVVTPGTAAVTHTLGNLSIGANVLTIGRGTNVGAGPAGISFGATTLTGAATFAPAANTLLTVGAINNGANTLTLTGAGNFTQTGILGAGAGGLTLAAGFSGVATTVLGNTFTGPVNINGGVLAIPGTGGSGDPTALGAGAKNVTLTNNGTLRIITANSDPTVGSKSFIIGAGGGTFDPSNAFTFTLNDANQLSGAGNLTVVSSGTGTGVVLLGSASTAFPGFTGNAIVNSGTLRLGNTNGLGNTAGQTVTVNSGGTLDLQAAAVPQNVTINGAGVANAGALTITSGSLTGTLTLGSNATIGGAGAQTLASTVSDGGNGFTLTKLGAGALTFTGNTAGFTGPIVVSAGSLVLGGTSALARANALTLNGGALSLLGDGNGLASGIMLPVTPGLSTPNPEIAATFTDPLTLSAAGTLTVGKVAAASSLNKSIVESGGLASTGAFTLTVTNNNQYGLNLTGPTTLTGAAPTFSVTNATVSNLVQGLTQSGKLTGAFGFTKAGTGTMLLTSGANDFTGNIAVTGGVLGATSDAALGNSANTITLNGTTATFEAYDNVTTTRAFIFANAAPANNVLGAVATKTLNIGSILTGGNGFNKIDNGTLSLLIDNTGFTGASTLSAGALLVGNGNALGSGAFSVLSSSQTALQLTGGITLANALTLTANNAGNNYNSGINGGGVIESVLGTNILTGALTQTSANNVSFGADAGATLVLQPSTYSGSNTVAFVGAGNINILTAFPATSTAWTKVGSGTVTLGVNDSVFVNAIGVNGGTFTVGSATTGLGSLGAANVATAVTTGGTFKVDDSFSAVPNRLGGTATPRTLSLAAGTFEYVTNAAGSSESTGALTSAWGANTIQVDTTAGSSSLTFASLSGNAVSGGSTLTFKAGGTGASFGTASNTVLFTAAPTLSSPGIGLIPRAIVIDANGLNFATYNNSGLAANTLGIQALTNYNIPTIASTTVAGTTVTVADTSVLTVGMAVYGPTVPAGDTIASILSPTTFALTTAASAGTPNLAYGSAADTNINSFAALRSVGENVKLGAGFITNGNAVNLPARTFGSVYLSGPGVTLDSGAPGSSTFTLASGNLLSTGAGTNTIGSGVILAAGAVEFGLSVAAGNTLAVNGALTSAANVTKGRDGNLVFNAKQYFNTGANYFTINGAGTVTLNAGNNTLFPGVQGSVNSANLAVGPGSTLDLNGNAQMVGSVNSPNSTAIAGSGGIITSLAGQGTLVAAGGAVGVWGGQINGNVYFAKAGVSPFTAYNNNTFSGGLLLMGNITTLTDSGRFSGLTASTPVNINYGILTLTNTGTTDLTDRIPDAAPISFRGGSIVFNGRAQTASSETLGALSLLQGNGQFTIATIAGGVASADLIFTSFNPAGVDGTVNLNQSSALGNGTRITFLSGPTVINGVTPQFEFSGTDLATYIPGVGLAQIAATGGPGYDATTTLAITSGPASAIRNIKLSAAGAVPAGGLLLNSLHANSQNVTFAAAGDVLSLTSGVLFGTGAFSIGATVDSGMLTATAGALTPAAAVDNASGNVPFYLYNGTGTRTVNSRIVDPNASTHLRLIVGDFNGAFFSLTDGANSYRGGTVVNGWITNVPTTSGLSLNGAAGAVVVPAGGLTLSHALVTEVTNGGQINPANVVTLNGSSTLTLVAANTLDSLVFNNNGDVNNPSVVTGGVLSLTNPTPISVVLPSNPATVPTVAGTLDFAGAAKSILVDPITVNGVAVAPLTPGLNISALIQNAGQLTKTGAGNLQLSATTSTFAGGVNVSQGGLIVNGSSTPSTVGSTVVTGPLGTGTLTMAPGTTLLAAAASTLANPVVLGGNVTFDGLINLTLNGTVALPASANTHVAVNAPQMTATLGGIVSGGGTAALTKDGLGTLVLLGANNFTGGFTLNGGTVLAPGSSPLGSGPIAINGGLLQLRSNASTFFGNNVTLGSGLTNAFIDINTNGGGQTGNTFYFGNLTSQPTTTLNVSGGSGYKLAFSGTNLSSAASPASFSPAAGLTIILPGGFSDANRPVDVGQGFLAFSGTNTFSTDTTISGTQSVAPLANSTSAPFGTGNIVLTAGSTLQIAPTPNNLSTTGYTAGGLTGRYFSFAAAPALTAANANGLVPGAVVGGLPSSDGDLYNHPVNILSGNGAAPSQDLEQYTGLLKIANAGTYTFGLDKDDEAVLFIDGVRVVALGDGSAGASAAGGYAVGLTNGSLPLTAGNHSIVVMHQNGGGGSGFQLVYNGPDTTTGSLAAPGAGFQNIALSNLSYNTAGIATAANGYLNAAVIGNNVNLASGNAATLDGATSQFNSAVNTLNLGNGSTLNVTNVEGTGFLGSIGATQVGSGVTVNTTTGTLYLIGGVNDSPSGALATAVGATGTANGLTKTGLASLILGPSAGTFTGSLNVLQGGLVAADPTALTSGVTTIGSASISNAGGATSLTTVAGTAVTVATGTTAGLFVGEGVSGTNIPAGDTIASITDSTHFVLATAATAAGTATPTYFSGATLDLNGVAGVAGNIVLNGAGPLTANTLSPAALYNSSAAPASATATVTIGSPVNGKAPAIGGYGNFELSGTVQDGAIPGQAWNKVGPDILTLSGTNTFTGVVSIAAGGGLKFGSAGAAGSVPASQTFSTHTNTTVDTGTSTTGLAVGMVVTGPGIPFGDTIATIPNGTSFTLTTAASSSTTGSLSFAAPFVVASGAMLDLGGQAIPATTRQLTLAGLGFTGLAANNSLGALINTNAAAATYSGNVNLTGTAVGIGSSNFDNSTSGGDITLTGTISGTTLTGVGINKVGLDNLNIQGNILTTTGGYNVQQGTLTISGAAGAFTAGAPVTVLSGATLLLDNTVANVAGGRLGLGLNGGETINGNFTIIGNSNAAGTTELLSTAARTLTFSNSASIVTLQPDAVSGGLLFNITSNTALARSAGATSLFRGNSLGTATLATVAATTNTAGLGDGTQANPGFIGSATTSGTSRGILPWALVDTTNTGAGSSFAAYDTTNGFRPLSFATDGVTNALTAGMNVLSTTGVTTTAGANIAINSLTLNGSGAVISAGTTLQVTSGGILNLSGTTAAPNTISGPGALSTAAAAELILHSTPGTALNISSQIAGTTGALTKADGGTVILSAKALTLSNVFVNGGTLQLNGGSQTLNFVPNLGQAPGTSNSASISQTLQVNLGGTVDLNGNNQVVANLNSANTLPNTGGIVTNNSATAATFQTVQNNTQIFAGSINGNLSYIRASGFNETFESASGFTGAFTSQGGNTILQDLGAFTGVTAINLNGGVLTWTDTGTQAVAARLPAGTPVTFNTGSFTYNARNGVQGAIAIGNATFNSGASLISVNPNNGGASLTIGTGTGASLTHNLGGTVTFFNAGVSGGIGDQNHVYLGAAPVLTGGLIGAWATAYQNDSFVGQFTEPGFAIYTSNGIETLNKDLVTLATGSVPAGVNGRVNASVTLPAGGATLNTLSIINSAATITFAGATDTLTLTTGGLLTGADTNNKVIGAALGQGQLTAGAGQPELFLHVGANTLTVNAKIIDNGVSGGLNVVADPMAGAGALTLTAANTYLGTTFLNGLNTTLNSAGGPAIPGNLVITGGVSAADSLTSTTTLGASNQIAPTAVVTLKGGGILNLANFNNTIAGLILDNTSGDLNGVGGTVNTGLGMLTVSGAITVTNNTNSFLVPQLNGFLTLSSATPTVSVAANPLNPAEVGLELGSVLSLAAPATTPLTLTGGGVIGLSGQSAFANGIAVTAGTTLTFGPPAATTGVAAPFASVASAQVNLAAGSTLDTRGFNGVIGSLTGSGTVTNTVSSTVTGGTLTTANTSTLTTGADNVASATFDGAFTNPFVQSPINVTKIGTGAMVLTADNSSAGATSPNAGTLTVSQGLVSLNGTVAKLGFSNDALQTGGSLTLDNTTNPLSNRLGGQLLQVSPLVAAGSVRTLTMQGGALNVLGNSGTAITEGVGQLNPANGGSVNLSSVGTAGVTLSVVNFSGQGGQTSLRLNADNLGIAAAGTPGDSNVTVSGTYSIPGTQGAGAAGSTLLPIRPDVVATDTVSGATAFVFKDVNGLRLLNPATEYLTTTATLVPNAAIAAANAFNLGLSSASAQQTISTNTPAGSLTLLSGGGLSNGLGAEGGNYGGGGLLTLTLGSAGVLALNGNAGLNIGALSSAGITLDLHVAGAATLLNLNGSINATTSGIVKADEGILSLNAPQYFTGTNGTNGLTVNGGKVVLNGGANTVLVTPTATVPTYQSLFLNSGTLDLNGNAQAVERLASVNPVSGQPANLITSTAAANLFTVPATGVTTTYAGRIGGAISLFKGGAGAATGTLILTGPNDYSGSTNVFGGTLALRDFGALTGTGAINLAYGQLTLDNTGLSDSTSRLSTTVPLNFSGATLTVAAGQKVESELIGTTTLQQGLNQFSLAQFNNNAQTGSFTLNVGNLVQTNNATLNFPNNTNVVVGQTGGNPHIFLGQLNNSAFTTANLTNGLIGGWAISNGSDFASYTAAGGVTALGSGISGVAAYSVNSLGIGASTDNINAISTTQSLTPAASTTLNATVAGLSVGQSVSGTGITGGTTIAAIGATSITLSTASTLQTAQTITFGATDLGVTSRTVNSVRIGTTTVLGLASPNDIVNVGTGGLLETATASIQGGQLTAGGASANPASLYAYTNAGTLTVNSAIANNAASGATVSLVRSGAGTLTLTPLSIVPFLQSASGATTLTSFSGAGTSGTGLTGLFVGELVTGTGIAANTTISGLTANTITLSTATTATTNGLVNLTFTPPSSTATTSTTAGNNVVTTAAGALGANFTPVAGMAVGGPAIPGGTTISSFTGSAAAGYSLTLSQPALASSATAVVTVGAISNTYTGATVNNGGNSVFGTLNISGQPGSIVVPGDLTVGNAGVTETVQGGIASTSNVSWVSGGTLTLFGTNTLNSLAFNTSGTSGGSATAAVGTLLNLSAANALTSVNNDLGHTPTISGTALAFTNAAPTINTSGLSADDLIVSAPITSAAGALSKTGAGSLVLSGASTFAAGLTVQGGSVIFGANSAGTPPTLTSGPAGTGTLTLSGGLSGSTILSSANFNIGNAVSVTGGGFTFGGNLAANNLTLSGIVTLGAGANSIGVAAPTVTGTISGVLTGGTDLTKTGPGALVLSNAANTYGGQTIVSGGILKNGVANAVPNTSLLTVNAGAEYDLNNVGQVSQQIAGTGLITNSGAAAQTLVVGGTSATDVTTNVNSAFAGGFTNAAQALNVTEVGLGTLTLSGTSNHTGKTTVKTGTLTASAANAFSPLSSVVLGNNLTGASATAGVLTLGGFNQALGGLIVQDDNSTVSALNPAVNTLSIATGTTLTLGAGGLIVGLDTALVLVPTVTKLTVTGGGTLAVSGGNVQIGVSQTSANAASNNVATVDLTGLTGGFTSTGTTFNVGQGNTSAGTLLLTNTANTIVATTIEVGDSNGSNGISASALQLGTGTNVLQADTINIGRSKGTDPGTIKFASQTAGSAGTVTISNKAGTGAANIDIGNVNGAGTAGGAVGTLDLRGHVATVNAGTVTLANNNNSSTGSTTGTLNFDTGTFTAATLNLAPKTAAGVATATATVNVSGGAFNVTGVTTLGSQVTAGNSVATLSLTGGTFTSGGNIVDGGGASTSNLTLNGGTLDLTGHTIGSAAVLIDNFLLQSGTLRNVAEINNGAALSKTTTGTLVLSGTNAFTGALTVSSGIVSVASNTGLGATSAGTTVSSGASLELQNNIVVGAESLSITGSGSGGTGALRNLSGNNVYGGPVAVAGNTTIQSDAGTLTLSPAAGLTGTGVALTVQGSGAVVLSTGVNSGTGGTLFAAGPGVLTLSGSSNYTGGTTISGGTVQINSTTSLGDVAGGVTLTGGTLEVLPSLALTSGRNFALGTGGSFQVDAGSTYTLNGTLADQNVSTAGVVNQTGPGTLALGAANTYSGGTNIKAGTLALLPSGSISGNLNITNGASFDVSALAGGFTLASGATLATTGSTGAATVIGSLTAAGTVSPGGPGAVGSLSVTGSLTLNGALQAQLAGSGLNDQITTPTLTLGSGATLQLSPLNGFQAGFDGTVFTLINNTGTAAVGGAGVFANATPMTFGTQTFSVVQASDGELFAVSYTGEGGAFTAAGGNDVVLMAVPEPSAVGSLIVGLASLAGLQRFRRRAARR